MNLNPTCPKAVVLLSGGLDSTLALAETLQTHAVPLALTFDYGQRAAEPEKAASAQLAAHFGVPHQVVPLPWLAQLLPNALHPERQAGEEEQGTRRVWVPNRNGVFLNIAAAFAEKLGAEAVVFGANADEAEGFPDNTEAYRDALTQAFRYSTLNQVRVLTPVGHLSKAQILARGLALGVPLHLIWSCYEAGNAQAHCGVCPSCGLLQQALSLTPVPRPPVFL
jgi:7-cyano-7-deazaguanine synthase